MISEDVYQNILNNIYTIVEDINPEHFEKPPIKIVSEEEAQAIEKKLSWLINDTRSLRYNSSLRAQGISNHIIYYINKARRDFDCETDERIACLIVSENHLINRVVEIERFYICEETVSTGLMCIPSKDLIEEFTTYYQYFEGETNDYYTDPTTNKIVCTNYDFQIGVRKLSESNKTPAVNDIILAKIKIITDYSNRSITQTRLLYQIIFDNILNESESINLLLVLEYIIKEAFIFQCPYTFEGIKSHIRDNKHLLDKAAEFSIDFQKQNFI